MTYSHSGLHAYLELQQTFLAAGGMIFGIGLMTAAFLRAPAVLQTQREMQATVNEKAINEPKESVLSQWKRLMKNPTISTMTGQINFYP